MVPGGWAAGSTPPRGSAYEAGVLDIDGPGQSARNVQGLHRGPIRGGKQNLAVRREAYQKFT
jgi:hypothetical protein